MPAPAAEKTGNMVLKKPLATAVMPISPSIRRLLPGGSKRILVL
jgi:hypothetical protein